MIKALRAGETILKKPTFNRFLVVRVFEYGWFVVDLMCAEDPSIPKLILPRNYDNWIRELEISEKKIIAETENIFNERLEQQWNSV